MQPSVTHVEGVAVPFVNPNPPSIVSVIQHDPVTVTETLNAQMVETQRAFLASQQPPTMTVPELTTDIAHQSAAQAPQRGLADSVGWGRYDGNTDHIRRATEEARQATALFNATNMVRSTDYSPNTGVPMATRSFGEVETTRNGPVTYRECDLTPISTTTDAVVRRKKMVDGMYRGMSLHDNSNVNGAIRTLALQNRSGPRYDGSSAMSLGNDNSSSGMKYQLSVGKNNSYTAPTRNIQVPTKPYSDVNIIRSELAKEDNVLHPQIPLPAFTQNTRAETSAFATRAWSPLRR